MNPCCPSSQGCHVHLKLPGRSPWLWEVSHSSTEPLPGGLTLWINQMGGAECARKKLTSCTNPKGKLLISPLREPGTGSSLQGSVRAGLPSPPVSTARQDTHKLPFPEASKISSSLGQNFATPQATGREPWQEQPPPDCRKWV